VFFGDEVISVVSEKPFGNSFGYENSPQNKISCKFYSK